MDTDTLIKRFKTFVETDDLSSAVIFFEELQTEEDIPWDYVYQKVYLHACLKKQRRFVDWMNSLFERLAPIEKIALRQMFAYGRYLFNK